MTVGSPRLLRRAASAGQQHRHLLCSTIADPAQRRHCQGPSEHNSNIFVQEQGWQKPTIGTGVPVEGSDELCVADDDGNFGRIDGDGGYADTADHNNNSSGGSQNNEDGSGKVLVVEYQYEIQTTLGMSATKLVLREGDDNALLELEKALADLLVADLFQGTLCEIGGNGGGGIDFEEASASKTPRVDGEGEEEGDDGEGGGTGGGEGGDTAGDGSGTDENEDDRSGAPGYIRSGEAGSDNNNDGGDGDEGDGDGDGGAVVPSGGGEGATQAGGGGATNDDGTSSGRGGEDGDLIGLSSKPDDELAPGVEAVLCRNSLVEAAERCYVVNGRLTLYGDDDISWALPIALDLVRLNMDDGGLNEVHPEIVDVRYRGDGIPDYSNTIIGIWPDRGDGDGDGGSEFGGEGNNTLAGGGPDDDATSPPGSSITGTQGDGATVQAWPWVVLGCGLLVLLTAVYVIRRRIRGGSSARDGGYEEASKISNPPPPDDDDSYLQEFRDGDGDNNNSSSFGQRLFGSSPNSPGLFFADSEDSMERRRRRFL